jgi:hypothetical protein
VATTSKGCIILLHSLKQAYSLSLVLHTPHPKQKVLPLAGSGWGTVSTQRPAPGHLWSRCSGWS